MQMKNFVIPAYLTLLSIVGCKSKDKDPVVDQRDSHVGTYVCNVKVENYTTNSLLRSYGDTLVF